ncbi:MAG: hypothetical protein VB065_05115, partial [Eubacteriales bacterium]|nr:hypothetical protein [Eubacteriales bacterium]
LLYAIRTWRAGAGEFEDYARKRIQEQVELFKRCLSQQRRVESPISLDMKVRPDGECTTTFADMIAFVEWDQTTVDVGLFIRSLAPDARMFVRLRMRTCTNSEIAQIMHITPAQVAELHRKVMDEATTYFELGGRAS